MGVNEIFITCVTTPAYDTKKTWQLPIVVKTVERSDSQCALADATGCTFTYTSEKTPILDQIIPRAIVPFEYTSWWGNFRVTNTNQIDKMLVGSLICDRFSLGLNEDEAYDGNAYDNLDCQISDTHPAGFYPSSFISKPGKSVNRSRLTTVRSTTLDTPHDIQVVSQQGENRPAQTISSQGGYVLSTVTNIPQDLNGVTAEWQGAQCTELTVDYIDFTCRLPAGLTNPTVDDQLRYTSGSGVRLQIYNTDSWDIDWEISQQKAKPNRQAYEDKIIPSTEYGYNYEDDGRSRQFFVFTGFFTPTRAGVYNFQTSSYYKSRVLFQTTGDSTDETTMTEVNTISDYTELRSPYSQRFDAHKPISDNLTLEAGKTYYFKIYALSSNAQVFYHSTGIRIPTGNNQKYVNSVGQVTRVKINYDFTKEVVSISYKDRALATKSWFKIHFIKPFGAKDKNSATQWSTPDNQFNRDSSCSSISNHFSNYNGVRSTCTSKDILDADNKKIGTIWELTFLQHRNQIKPTFRFQDNTDSPIFTVVREAGPVLSGTFRLKVNNEYLQINKSSDIPFNTQDWVINSAIQNLLGTNNIDSHRTNEFIDGAYYTFDFYGVATAVPFEVVESESKLVGEPSKIKITVENLREAQDQIIYHSIENELLTQRSTQPHLLVKVNGVPSLASVITKQHVISVLQDSDAFTFTGFTDDEANKKLTITGLTSTVTPIVSSWFRVNYGGQPCKDTLYTSGTVECYYEFKVAGSYKPEVSYFKNGVAISTAVTPKETKPIIDSLSQTTVYSFGGSEIVITGKYFPVVLSSDLIVTVEGKVATVTATSNTSITILTPANLTIGTVNVVVTYQNLASNSSSVQVDNTGAVTLTSINKKLVSPVEKTLIEVTGTNFGTDKTQLTAFLDELDAAGSIVKIGKYQVNVVVATDTQVKILLGGGLPGNYRLRVVKKGKGSNDPTGPAGFDQIQYNILISSFSRTTSSKYGGAKLTITGQNFSTSASDNQVLVVYSPINSEFCIITSATTTKLECTLPNMSTHFETGATAQSFTVEVYGKLIAKAIVDPNSPFNPSIQYQDSDALSITAVSSEWQLINTEYSITGTGLPTNVSDVQVVVLGNEGIAVTVNSATDTTIKYLSPNLPAGKYQLVVRTASGDSNPIDFYAAESSFNFAPADFSTIFSSGRELTFTTSGGLPDQDPIFKFNGVKAELLSYNTVNGQVRVRFPATATGSNIQLFSARGAKIALDAKGNIPWVASNTKFNVVASTWTVTSLSVSGNVINVTGTGLTNLSTAYLQAPNQPKSTQFASTSIVNNSATSATITFGDAPAGSYKLYLLNASFQYPTITDASVSIDLPSLTVANAVTSSFSGGQQFTINGSRFNTNDKNSNVVTICGNQATVVSVDASTLVVSTPPAYTKASIASYKFPANQEALTGFTTFGNDPSGNSQYLGDGDLLFYYSSTQAGECSAGLNFGSSRVVLSKFELYPRSQGVLDASLFFNTKFQASNDQTNWVDLITIGTEFHLGKNMYLIDTLYNTNSNNPIYKDAYTYFRILDTTGNSKCELVEIKLFGWKTSSVAEVSNTLTCPINVQVNGSKQSTTNQNVVYDKTKTFQILSITPNYGDISGNTDVVITLDNSVSGKTVTVTIDGVVCASPTPGAGNTVTCKTASKSTNDKPSLIISVDGFQVVNNGVFFYYGNLWSKDETWGNDFPPIDGDLVYVNENKTLIVDVPYVGVLNTVVVDKATIIFANDKNIHFEANNILVRHGSVIIGTEAAPITGTVRITMHGKEEDKQFPTVGNKGLSVHEGSIDIQGIKRAVTWTELSKTAVVGDKQIEVFADTGFDWAVGESIVIASSDFAHGHAERRTIKTINTSGGKSVITFDEALLARHISETETYKGKTINMRAEVGLLSRNIIFEGDESSIIKSYGAHIMLHGSTTSARIRYAEFTRTGQPKIIGRYPIHFHMVGDVSGSIVEGNAVHDSFARVLTIHATHYLQVKNNVGYNCAGHNIFLEDGIETNNVIEHNLMIGTRQVWSMLQSDITAASYWITNPLNRVVNNRAAGGDFYGFWYEIKEKPDGPSARNDICPQGMALGEFKGNVAHSYFRFGLRIFVMTNLKYPCQPHRNDGKANPFEDNPSFQITFQDFVSYRNHEDGVLAEEVGNMVFDNFALLDNKQSGFNVYLTNRTDEEVVLRNSIVVGKSQSNPASDGELVNTRGVITPRTDGFKVQNTHFENFGNDMTALKSCSFCFHFKKWVQGGKLTRFSGISFNNVSKKMYWDPNYRREIYEDIDGSLTGKSSKQWITPTGVHLKDQTACQTSDAETTTWDDGVICSKQIVRVEFSNPEKIDEFRTVALYVQPTNDAGVPIGPIDENSFYKSKTVKIKNHAHDLLGGFVGTFLTGQIFSVQWELTGIDFTHMSVQLSPYHVGNTPDDTLVLRFPYHDYRETFEVGKMIANVNTVFYKNVTDNQEPTPLAKIKSKDCSHGDWYNDVTESAFYLCLNDKGRDQSTPNQKLERTDVNALKCKKNCPLPPGKCVKDGIPRKLSDISTWQDKTEDGILYNQSGSTELLIPCPWEVLVDQDIINFKKITVQGTLRIDPTKDVNIKAYGIWIKGGTIIAEGQTAGSTYTNRLTFELLGDRSEGTQFVVDDTIEVGNKVILNTGSFVLRGNPPSSTSTRLTASANPSDSTITVESAAGWKVGDTIAIASTQLKGDEEEQFKISAISGNTVTLSGSIKYYHFGSNSATLSETWGSYTQSLDLRAQVLHLTRNIVIKGSPVSDNLVWGCRVLNFYWMITSDANGDLLPELEQLHLRGTLDWNGVEMSSCGQANTVRGALDFQKCGADQEKVVSLVKNSAIHDCPGYCANIEESAYIRLENNNFFFGRPILMRISNVNNVAITGNHFAAARKREYAYSTEGTFYDMNAAIYSPFLQDPIETALLISNNVAQGSEGPCLVLPHTSCDNASKISDTLGVFGNQAQTCLVGAMFKLSSDGCQWAGKIAVARSTKGLMVNPTRPGIVVEHVLAAESDRSVILRFAHEGDLNVGKFQNSAIYGVAITNSADAYNTDEKAQVCKNTSGTQNLVVTRGGEDFPLKVGPLAFDVICNSEVYDSALFQTNVKYVRFRKTYTDANLTKCGNNHMMATHPSASDATAGTYNNNVTCEDCTEDSYFNFMSPNPKWDGWFGGCGLFLCTGPENVLNVDFTGSLFSNKATTAISHNEGIKTAKCKKQPNWNDAYSCDGTDYVQVEWESRAPDFNTRSHAPVMVKSLDGTYSNKINMYREWVWDGNEPMNKRENRFLSTTLINTMYKVEYNGLNPYNIVHRIQPRTLVGEPNIWIGYTVTYQVPMNIEISVEGGSIVPSYLVSDNVDLTTKTQICGANIYDWNTRTVQFIFNGAIDCIVRAVVLDTVRIHAKVVLTVAEFFKDDVKASFISKVASFLNINDTSRIKIVGVISTTGRFLQNGQAATPSFELVFDITTKPQNGAQADPATTFQDLNQKADKLKTALDANAVPGLDPNTYFITKSETFVASDSAGGIYGKTTTKPIVTESSSDSDDTLAIILGVVIGLVVISIAIVGFCAYRRYKQKQNILSVQQAEIDHSVAHPEKETAKVHPIVLDPAADQLQEKANCSSAPFQN